MFQFPPLFGTFYGNALLSIHLPKTHANRIIEVHGYGASEAVRWILGRLKYSYLLASSLKQSL
jgi:hypothetical protein